MIDWLIYLFIFYFFYFYFTLFFIFIFLFFCLQDKNYKPNSKDETKP